MFTHNKYYNTYLAICRRGQSRAPHAGYVERHHVIPRSFGGDNSSENITVLTAKEHYIAHLCLYRCTEGNLKRKMGYALYVFKRQSPTQQKQHLRFSSRIYASLKEQMFVDKSNTRKWTKRERLRMSKLKRGKSWGSHSTTTRQHLSTIAKKQNRVPPNNTGKTWKLKRPRKPYSPTPEHRQKLRIAALKRNE